MFSLFTHRYASFRPGSGVPVRITLGAPRHKLPYTLTHQIAEAAPTREYFGRPQGEFAAAYRAQLDRLGVGFFARRFEEISGQGQDPRLVLLCFEDLGQQGQWCHRRMFAQWWEERTGVGVRELGAVCPSYEQGELL
ncbi:hypothetical protein [Streptomyces luteireticuli]|uniref:hypothetical protein n=1 Tax=Streptomyces luteireticuli TaxID=173858 RepID=UPI003557EC05